MIVIFVIFIIWWCHRFRRIRRHQKLNYESNADSQRIDFTLIYQPQKNDYPIFQPQPDDYNPVYQPQPDDSNPVYEPQQIDFFPEFMPQPIPQNFPPYEINEPDTQKNVYYEPNPYVYLPQNIE